MLPKAFAVVRTGRPPPPPSPHNLADTAAVTRELSSGAEALGKDGRRWLTPKNLQFKVCDVVKPKELESVDETQERRYL